MKSKFLVYGILVLAFVGVFVGVIFYKEKMLVVPLSAPLSTVMPSTTDLPDWRIPPGYVKFEEIITSEDLASDKLTISQIEAWGFKDGLGREFRHENETGWVAYFGALRFSALSGAKSAWLSLSRLYAEEHNIEKTNTLEIGDEAVALQSWSGAFERWETVIFFRKANVLGLVYTYPGYIFEEDYVINLAKIFVKKIELNLQ